MSIITQCIHNLLQIAGTDRIIELTCRIAFCQVDSQAENGAQDAEHHEVRDKILGKILRELMLDSKAEVRSAACVWLVALCTFTGKPPRLLRRLPEIQDAFSNLLGDSSELAQVLRPLSRSSTRADVQCACFVSGMMSGSRMLSVCLISESSVLRPLLKISYWCVYSTLVCGAGDGKQGPLGRLPAGR